MRHSVMHAFQGFRDAIRSQYGKLSDSKSSFPLDALSINSNELVVIWFLWTAIIRQKFVQTVSEKCPSASV